MDAIARMAAEADAAERALLGAILIRPDVHGIAESYVSADDFHTPRNGQLWDAISTAIADGERVDAVTVTRYAADIPGEYLMGLINATPSTSNARRYAEQVADLATRRRLIHAAGEISQLAQTTHADHAADEARRILAGIDTTGGTPERSPTATELLATVDMSYDWLVPGMFERGDRMLVTGVEGSGKSVHNTQIAMQVASGVHPWSLEAVEPRNVTVVDLENGRRNVMRRVQDVMKKGAHVNTDRLSLEIRPSGINLLNRADRRWLFQTCQANRTELLVIGPVYRLMGGSTARGDVGGEDQARQVTGVLDDLRARLGITLLMETHAPHGSGITGRDLRPFGSSVWLRWPEFGLGLRQASEDDKNTFSIEHWRNPRDFRAFPRTFRRGGSWPCTFEVPSHYSYVQRAGAA